MDSPDLESLFASFDDKISLICAKFALLHTYMSDDKEKCVELNQYLGGVNEMLHNMDQIICEQYEQMQMSQQKCNDLYSLISDHYDYIDNYAKSIPEQKKSPIKNTKTSQQKNAAKSRTFTPRSKSTNSVSNAVSTKKVSPVNVNKAVKKSVETSTNSAKNVISPYPEIKPLTQSEYDSIPKYMLGRLSLNTINESIDAFNITIFKKYNFIKAYRSSSGKDDDLKRYQSYKSNETIDTKGVYFCIINDIKELSEMKNDATLRKVIICLRHCKRIKEIRGQNLIRYCVLN